MKRKLSFLLMTVMLMVGAVVNAQTPDQIVQRMSKELDRANTEGFQMDFGMKMPIVGWVMTHTWVSGNKYKIETKIQDKHSIIWTDATTRWDYNVQDNIITISNKGQAEGGSDTNLSLMSGVTDGYDVKLKKETADAWYLECKKQRSNKDKDAPKKMDFIVSKTTYLPIKMSTKVSVFTISMENISLGVKESEVTFNPAKYPNVKIVDNR